MEKRTIFIANLSHEIRTPLNAILGFAQLGISNACQTEEQKRYFDKINTSAKQLMALLDNITDFATINSSAFKLTETPINVENLVSFLSDQFTTPAKEKSLDFSIQLESSLPRYFLGDSYRIEQILTHLIENAIRFTSQGRVSVLISESPLPSGVLEHSLASEGADEKIIGIQFIISDTGPGIQESKLATLFQPFNALEFESQARHSGLSLGLPISQALTLHMSGSIELINKPEGGLSVTVCLPVRCRGAQETGLSYPTIDSITTPAKEVFVMPDLSSIAPKVTNKSTIKALALLQEYADLKKPRQCKDQLVDLRNRFKNYSELTLVLDQIASLILQYRFVEASKLIEILTEQLGGAQAL